MSWDQFSAAQNTVTEQKNQAIWETAIEVGKFGDHLTDNSKHLTIDDRSMVLMLIATLSVAANASDIEPDKREDFVDLAVKTVGDQIRYFIDSIPAGERAGGD